LQLKIPYDEILAAWQLPKAKMCNCLCPKEYSLIVYCLSRKRRQPASWQLEEHVLSCNSSDTIKEWVAAINAAVQLSHDRPRNLLVFVNPYSGARRAGSVWQHEAMPVFQKARIKFTVIETLQQDHAKETLTSMKADEMAQYQGVVAVGGDGLFQEVVMGLLQHRTRSPAHAAATARIRVGHIPGGSTDAVAYTLHGTRSAEAAALHIALGDRMPLDVARVDADDGTHKHFVCQAAYGFLGDVMRTSESLRFMGPSRYEVAGAIKFLQLRSYRMHISYRRAASSTADMQQVCAHRCEVCRLAGLNLMGEKGCSVDILSPPTQASGAATPGEASAGISTPIRSNSGPLPSGLAPLQLPGLSSAGGTSPGRGVSPPSSGHAGLGLGAMQVTGQLSQGYGSSGDVSSPGRDAKDSYAASQQQQHQQLLLAGQPCSAGGVGGLGGPGLPLSIAADGGQWTVVEGDFVSVMAVVTPCRSDKSRKGIIPHGHLSDGRMYLVMVQKCNHLEYLRFLIRLSRKGLTDACYPFVKVVPVTAVAVRPVGPESSWNVDGELLSHNTVHIRVQRGLVDVFARGVELAAPPV